MDNKNIPTSYGTIIIIIIAVTVFGFLWRYEKIEEAGVEEKPCTAIEQTPVLGYCAQQDREVEGKNNSEHSQQSPASSKNLVQNNQASNSVVPVNLSDPFQYLMKAGFYGTLSLTGYLNVKHRICKPGSMCNKTVDYAFLVVTSTDNNTIYDFIKEEKGNSFVSDDGIGLGCYEKEKSRIYSTNLGDDGGVENIISGSDLQKLLSSNENKTVKIKLTKPYFTGGGDAPECYSHFRSFHIITKS